MPVPVKQELDEAGNARRIGSLNASSSRPEGDDFPFRMHASVLSKISSARLFLRWFSRLVSEPGHGART